MGNIAVNVDIVLSIKDDFWCLVEFIVVFTVFDFNIASDYDISILGTNDFEIITDEFPASYCDGGIRIVTIGIESIVFSISEIDRITWNASFRECISSEGF